MADVNPYELIYRYRMADESAEREILNTYNFLIKGVVNKLIQTYRPFAFYSEDLFLEGKIALLNAAQSYNYSLHVPFPSYAGIIIQRRLWNYLNHYRTKSVVPLHTVLGDDRDNGVLLENVAAPSNLDNPEYHLRFQLAQEELNSLMKTLSPAEVDVIRSWLSSMSHVQGSEKCGISYRTYTRRLQRVRGKLKDEILK